LFRVALQQIDSALRAIPLGGNSAQLGHHRNQDFAQGGYSNLARQHSRSIGRVFSKLYFSKPGKRF
jgi:hypothetical protein